LKKISELEEALAFQIRAVGLKPPHREYRFAPGRQYRADFAWPNEKLLVECEGGLFSKGKGWHLSIGGYLDDIEKYNLACLLGFRVLRYAANKIKSGVALSEIECALRGGLKLPQQKQIEELGLRAVGMGA
jgi:very-short-patch-repair endonuclease